MSVKIADRLQRVRPYGERRIALGPGVVWFSNPDLGTGLCFPIQKIGYRARLSGPAGAVEAFLTFINPTAQAQSAYFLFPLDRNVTPVKIRGKAGSRQLETDVIPPPSEDAAEELEARLPAELCKLFQEESEDVLAIPLGEIPSGGEVSLQILLATMAYETGESGAGFSFRLPLMVSQSLTTLKEADRDQLTLASGLDRGAQVVISIQIEASDLEPGTIATSQLCGVARNANGDLAVEYDRRKPLEARDFVLDYQLWAGNRPKAWLRSQGRHFLLNFFPPVNPTPSTPRRLVILVDGSEEMNRVGVQRAAGCLSLILKNLAAEDKFALVAFNREVAGYKNGDFVEASKADEAIEWLHRFQFEGGADLKELLRRVVTLPRQNDSVLSVLLVSAGRIGNEPELYRLLQGSRDILRLFPIMLGHRADPHFARAAARLTGGYAFRALTQDSVSRVAERILEHTRQPVLEGVGLQDKGLQYQGESLTPKYPTGLNWRRPITVMGTHAGRGGLEAGGSGPGGTLWSEYLELKPAFHKVLANVWAHVKSNELDDEAQMLDRAERGLLQKVIINLSREFKLLNRYTAAVIRTSDGQEILAPSIDATNWYRRIEREISRGQSANELLEKQRVQKEEKTKAMNPGREGLAPKDSVADQSSKAFFGKPKISTKNKLSPSVKEGLFSKPMLTRGGAEKPRPKVTASVGVGSSGSNHVAATTAGTDFQLPGSVTPPPRPTEPEIYVPEPVVPEPTRPTAVPEPIVQGADLELSETPTTSLGRIPVIGPAGSLDLELDLGEEPTSEFDLSGPDEVTKKLRLPENFGQPGPTSGGPQILRGGRDGGGGFRPPTLNIGPPSFDSDETDLDGPDTTVPLPRPGPREASDERQLPAAEPTPVAPISPPPVSPPPVSPPVIAPKFQSPVEPTAAEVAVPARRVLPTPRELALQVSAEARQGKPEETAKNALRNDPKLRQTLMSEMRLLHSSLAEVHDAVKLSELTEAVLFRLAEVAPKAELLVRAYGLGYQARGVLESDLEEAKNKLKFWLTRFAKLF